MIIVMGGRKLWNQIPSHTLLGLQHRNTFAQYSDLLLQLQQFNHPDHIRFHQTTPMHIS